MTANNISTGICYEVTQTEVYTDADSPEYIEIKATPSWRIYGYTIVNMGCNSIIHLTQTIEVKNSKGVTVQKEVTMTLGPTGSIIVPFTGNPKLLCKTKIQFVEVPEELKTTTCSGSSPVEHLLWFSKTHLVEHKN